VAAAAAAAAAASAATLVGSAQHFQLIWQQQSMHSVLVLL
jgi:hypothetical protein